jgi:hypothetical protein
LETGNKIKGVNSLSIPTHTIPYSTYLSSNNYQLRLLTMWAPIIFVASLLSFAQATPVSPDARELSLDARGLSVDALVARGLLQERQGSCFSITRPANDFSVNNIGQVDITRVIGGAPDAESSWALNNFIRVDVTRLTPSTVQFRFTNTSSRSNRLIITAWA